MARILETGTFKAGNNRTIQQFQRVLPYKTPKIDWTANDYYNYFDLNRVEYNTEYINSLLPSSLNLTSEKSRVVGEWEFFDSVNRIEENIKKIRDVFGVNPSGWKEPFTQWTSVKKGFGYIDANRLERNIEGLRKMIIGTKARTLKTGTFKAGNNRTVQNFAR